VVQKSSHSGVVVERENDAAAFVASERTAIHTN
jgi:hypothetical protein